MMKINEKCGGFLRSRGKMYLRFAWVNVIATTKNVQIVWAVHLVLYNIRHVCPNVQNDCKEEKKCVNLAHWFAICPEIVWKEAI